METEKPNPETEPEQKTTQANKQNAGGEADEPASPPVVQPLNAEGGEPTPAESYDETDRKQDETLQSIAKQTEWEAKQAEALERQTSLMEKQTVWMRRQTLWTIALTVVTLAVLIYHGYVMREQSRAADDQTVVMKGQSEAMKTQTSIMGRQLDSMNSDSAQTQDLIAATSTSANATKDIAAQNKDLVTQAGKQTEAMTAQAIAAKESARAAEQSAQTAEQSMIASTRPYVYVAFSLRSFERDQRARFDLSLVNDGNSPAGNVTANFKMLFSEFPIAPTANYGITYKEFGRPMIVQPTDVPPHKIRMVNIHPDALFTAAIIEDIERRKLTLMLYGTGSYRGVGGEYPFQICKHYRPSERDFADCIEPSKK